MSALTYTKSGNKATTATKLNKTIFEIEVTNHELLKQAYVTHLANARPNLAKTKKRGEVSGGGKKPWKQKGTGRARFGSSRVPLWRGGGVVFGPTGNENYSKKLNRKAKQLAVKQALSAAHKAGKVSVIESLEAKEGKTKPLFDLMKKLGVTRKALVVVDAKTPELLRATNNLQNIKLATANYLSVVDVLDADHIIFTNAGLDKLNTWLTAEAVKVAK